MEGLVLMAVITAVLVVVAQVRRRPPAVQEHDVPGIGMFRYDTDTHSWRTTVQSAAGPIGFLVAGSERPDSGLLETARTVLASSESFMAAVQEYLRREADRGGALAEESQALRLEEVCLFWPNRPKDGMLYFKGSDPERRVWRCDWLNGIPQPLGYDA